MVDKAFPYQNGINSIVSARTPFHPRQNVWNKKYKKKKIRKSHEELGHKCGY